MSTSFHIDSKGHQSEYEKRLNQISTYKTDIDITPINKGEFAQETVPLFLVNTPELTALNERIIENSKEITLLGSHLPSVSQGDFYSQLLINEIQSTNEVENVRSTKKEIAEVLEEVKRDNSNKNTLVKKRFSGLVNLYFFLDQDSEINKVEDIREIYDELVASEIAEEDKLDGDIFRKDSVSVDSGGQEIHVGALSETKIISMLGQMIQFINNDKMPTLYKLMASHYLFEYIHPFYDGNGRTGRYMVCKLLSKKLDRYSAVTFSYVINRNKNKYYKSFSQTSHPLNKGELTFFVKDMLEMIEEGQEQVLSILEENVTKIDKIKENLKDLDIKEFDKSVLYIMAQSAIFQPPESRVSINELADYAGCERRKIMRVLNNFEEEKLVRIKSRPVVITFSDEFLDSLLS